MWTRLGFKSEIELDWFFFPNKDNSIVQYQVFTPVATLMMTNQYSFTFQVPVYLDMRFKRLVTILQM